MKQEEKDNIIRALVEKDAILPCPRCGNEQFGVVDGYFSHTVQQNKEGISIGGVTLPTVVTACTKCGFISQHALGALDLLSSDSENTENKVSEE